MNGFGIGAADTSTLAVHRELDIQRLDHQECRVVALGHAGHHETSLAGVHQPLELLPHIARPLRIARDSIDRLLDLHWNRVVTQVDDTADQWPSP